MKGFYIYVFFCSEALAAASLVTQIIVHYLELLDSCPSVASCMCNVQSNF